MNIKHFLTIIWGMCAVNFAIAQSPKVSNYPFLKLTDEERIKDSINNTFEHLSLDKPDGTKHRLRGMVEKHIIARGDTNRIKYVFDPTYVTNLVAEGIREATPEELKKGECIFTVKPEKTKWIKIIQHYSDGTKFDKSGYLLYVVEPEKYESVMQRYKSLKGWKDKNDFLDSIAGGRWIDFKYGRIK